MKTRLGLVLALCALSVVPSVASAEVQQLAGETKIVTDRAGSALVYLPAEPTASGPDTVSNHVGLTGYYMRSLEPGSGGYPAGSAGHWVGPQSWNTWGWGINGPLRPGLYRLWVVTESPKPITMTIRFKGVPGTSTVTLEEEIEIHRAVHQSVASPLVPDTRTVGAVTGGPWPQESFGLHRLLVNAPGTARGRWQWCQKDYWYNGADAYEPTCPGTRIYERTVYSDQQVPRAFTAGVAAAKHWPWVGEDAGFGGNVVMIEGQANLRMEDSWIEIPKWQRGVG